MFTEESSQQQLTPLSEERPASPVANIDQQVQPVAPAAISTWWYPWLEVVKALALWVTSVALLLSVPVIVALPYIVYRIIASGPPSAEALSADKWLVFLSVLGIIPAHLLTLFVVRTIVSQGGRYSFWKTIGFEWPENIGPTAITLMSGLLAIILLALAYLVTTLYGGSKTQLDLLIESSLYTRFATAFVAVATAPLIEEVIYRGVIYPALERAAGMGVAIALVSLLFAGVHVFQYKNNISVIIVITLLSIVLTVARAVTGKVLPSFIIHLVFNGIQSLLLVLAPFMDQDLLK